MPVAAPAADPSVPPDPSPTPDPSVEPTPSPTSTPDPSPTPEPTPTWRGTLNIYDAGAWVRQYKSTWCTAAATQMMVNMVLDRRSTSLAVQRQMYHYARGHDTLRPSSAGSDPAGWTAALVRYGAGNYRHVTYQTRNQALRAAATAIRRTGRPVGLLAWYGRHAWVMTGFRTTADPARTSDFLVTGLYISGPLVSKDPRPNRFLGRWTVDANFGRYWERDGWKGWIGKYVIIIPVT